MSSPGRPTVSVAMATYNGRTYVSAQVASILHQLGPADELVVVDDASIDDTVQVLAGIDDARLTVHVHDVNQGYVATFAEALARTSGDVVLLADQDDVWLDGRVDAMAGALVDADVVATNLVTLDGPPSIRGPYGQRDWHLRAVDSTHRWRNVVGVLIGNRPYYGSAMGLRRDALERVLPFPAFLVESHDLWIALYGNIQGRLAHVELRTTARRFHTNNASPARPRGASAVLRSRWMLLRCTAALVARGRPRR